MEKPVEYHRNLFVVGDPDQTIYTWRGADVRYLPDFADAHEGCKTILMTENYRSTPEVLGVANSLIEKTSSAFLLSSLRHSATFMAPTVWHHAKSPEEEAVDCGRRPEAARGGVAYRDMAVLVSRALCIACGRRSINAGQSSLYTVFRSSVLFWPSRSERRVELFAVRGVSGRLCRLRAWRMCRNATWVSDAWHFCARVGR